MLPITTMECSNSVCILNCLIELAPLHTVRTFKKRLCINNVIKQHAQGQGETRQCLGIHESKLLVAFLADGATHIA